MIIQKLIALISSRETKEQLTARMRDNPRTTAVGVVCLALFGAAGSLYDSGYLIAGGLVAGVAAFVSCITLLFAGDAGPKQ